MNHIQHMLQTYNVAAPHQQLRPAAAYTYGPVGEVTLPPSYKPLHVVLSDFQRSLQTCKIEVPLWLCRCVITFERVIGKGGFAIVFKARSRRTGQPFAIKVMKKRTLVAENQTGNVNTELHLLKKMRSPFVSKTFGAFQDVENLYIVLEFIPGGDLGTLISMNKRIFEITARFYAIEIVLALSYIHSEGILHRDIKPSNIIIAANGHIKLSDFGLATQHGVSCHLGGTIEYMAPELFGRIPEYTTSIDWYSFGILMFVMLTGLQPYVRKTELCQRVLLEGPSAIQWPRGVMNGNAMDMIWSLLLTDPGTRLGSRHRGGARDVMVHTWFRGVDWERAMQQKMYPPFIPALRNCHDTKMFAVPTGNVRLHEHDSLGGQYSALFPDYMISYCCYDVIPNTTRS